jgi:hypothetical protein
VPVAKVTIAGTEHYASEESPVVFGRAGAVGVVGLDAADMKIASIAGSIEWKGLWFVVNRSEDQELYIDEGAGGGPQPLGAGQRRAVTASSTIEVRGKIGNHTIGVTVPEADLSHFSGDAVSAATTLPEIGLEEADRKVVEALFQGYLRPGPRCQPRPRTYAEAAQWLGDDWTAARVRKRVERLKLRLSRNGPPFDDR